MCEGLFSYNGRVKADTIYTQNKDVWIFYA